MRFKLIDRRLRLLERRARPDDFMSEPAMLSGFPAIRFRNGPHNILLPCKALSPEDWFAGFAPIES